MVPCLFRLPVLSLKSSLHQSVVTMAPVLSFLIGSLLAARGLAEPFEKLFSVPEGK
jgi:hypothetical protein